MSVESFTEQEIVSSVFIFGSMIDILSRKTQVEAEVGNNIPYPILGFNDSLQRTDLLNSNSRVSN